VKRVSNWTSTQINFAIAGALVLGVGIYAVVAKLKSRKYDYKLPVDWNLTTHTKTYFLQLADSFQAAVWGVGSGFYEDDPAMHSMLATIQNQNDYNAFFNAYGIRGCVGLACYEINLAQTVSMYLDGFYLDSINELFFNRGIDVYFEDI